MIELSVYQWLCLFSVPALLLAFAKYVTSQIRGVRLGVQALLRAQMIADYNKWEDRGYAPIYARQNFENCWQQYHNLGVNGVMDDLHADALSEKEEHPPLCETGASAAYLRTDFHYRLFRILCGFGHGHYDYAL